MLRGPEYRDAESVERGGGCGGGIPLPSRLGSLGERRKLPQRDPGQSPSRKRILVHFELEKNECGDDKFDIFVILLRIFRVKFTRPALIFFSHSQGA